MEPSSVKNSKVNFNNVYITSKAVDDKYTLPKIGASLSKNRISKL